jgi:hypothetical protein
MVVPNRACGAKAMSCGGIGHLCVVIVAKQLGAKGSLEAAPSQILIHTCGITAINFIGITLHYPIVRALEAAALMLGCTAVIKTGIGAFDICTQQILCFWLLHPPVRTIILIT